MTDPRASIVIITHEMDEFHRSPRLVHQFIPRWEAMGLRVAIVTPEDPFVPANMALLHVDLSIVPDKCQRLAARYPKVLNGRVLDIRKRHHSELLVARDGPDPGQVIVKSDWNYGGERDFRYALTQSFSARMLRQFGKDERYYHRQIHRQTQLPWTRRAWLPFADYKVFANRADVPIEVWSNPNLVVEKFLSERDGDLYCCRHWLFFGDREVHRRTVSANPVVKGEGRIEPLADPIPERLRVLRRELGFDYGKFDYGFVDGRVVLYDTNRTPGVSADVQRHAHTVKVLTEGIRSFLDEVIVAENIAS